MNRFAAAFLMACCLTYGAYQTGRAFLHPNQGIDLAPDYVAAQLLREGKSAAVYDEQAVAERAHALGLHGSNGAGDPIPRYGYPPWLLLVYAPLSFCGFAVARSIWFAVGSAAALSAGYVMGRTLAADSKQKNGWVLVAVAATCVYFPTTYGLMGGQANDVPLLAIVACLALLKADRPFLAGLVLAPAGMWKIFTGIPLLFLFARREWRAVAGFAAGSAAIVALSLPFTGYEVWANWLDLMRRSYSTATAVPRNHSIAAGMQVLIASPAHARVATLLLQILATGAAAFVLARPARRDEPRYTLQYAVTLVLALLLVPMSWEHYGVFLLPAFLACAAIAMESVPVRLPAVVLGVAFGVWAFALQLGSEYAALTRGLYALVAPIKMYATLALLALCVRLASRAARTARRSE